MNVTLAASLPAAAATVTASADPVRIGQAAFGQDFLTGCVACDRAGLAQPAPMTVILLINEHAKGTTWRTACRPIQ